MSWSQPLNPHSKTIYYKKLEKVTSKPKTVANKSNKSQYNKPFDNHLSLDSTDIIVVGYSRQSRHITKDVIGIIKSY